MDLHQVSDTNQLLMIVFRAFMHQDLYRGHGLAVLSTTTPSSRRAASISDMCSIFSHTPSLSFFWWHGAIFCLDLMIARSRPFFVTGHNRVSKKSFHSTRRVYVLVISSRSLLLYYLKLILEFLKTRHFVHRVHLSGPRSENNWIASLLQTDAVVGGRFTERYSCYSMVLILGYCKTLLTKLFWSQVCMFECVVRFHLVFLKNIIRFIFGHAANMWTPSKMNFESRHTSLLGPKEKFGPIRSWAPLSMKFPLSFYWSQMVRSQVLWRWTKVVIYDRYRYSSWSVFFNLVFSFVVTIFKMIECSFDDEYRSFAKVQTNNRKWTKKLLLNGAFLMKLTIVNVLLNCCGNVIACCVAIFSKQMDGIFSPTFPHTCTVQRIIFSKWNVLKMLAYSVCFFCFWTSAVVEQHH